MPCHAITKWMLDLVSVQSSKQHQQSSGALWIEWMRMLNIQFSAHFIKWLCMYGYCLFRFNSSRISSSFAMSSTGFWFRLIGSYTKMVSSTSIELHATLYMKCFCMWCPWWLVMYCWFECGTLILTSSLRHRTASSLDLFGIYILKRVKKCIRTHISFMPIS